MPLNDFYNGETLYGQYFFQTSGSVLDISNDEIIFWMKDSDEIVLTSSFDVTSSGSQGIAILNVSSSLTQLSASCYEYEISWHTFDGYDKVFESSTINVKPRVRGSV